MLWNWTNMQICTLEFPSVSFGRANALEHCKQCKHSNDVAAHFQMLPTLKREEKPFYVSKENLCIKFFFRRKRVWRDLRLLRQITLSWAPLTTASLGHSDLQNFAMFTGVYGRRWRMLLWNCVFAKEHLERMTFRKPLSEYYLKRSGWEVKACESDFSRDNFSNNWTFQLSKELKTKTAMTMGEKFRSIDGLKPDLLRVSHFRRTFPLFLHRTCYYPPWIHLDYLRQSVKCQRGRKRARNLGAI